MSEINLEGFHGASQLPPPIGLTEVPELDDVQSLYEASDILTDEDRALIAELERSSHNGSNGSKAPILEAAPEPTAAPPLPPPPPPPPLPAPAPVQPDALAFLQAVAGEAPIPPTPPAISPEELKAKLDMLLPDPEPPAPDPIPESVSIPEPASEEATTPEKISFLRNPALMGHQLSPEEEELIPASRQSVRVVSPPEKFIIDPNFSIETDTPAPVNNVAARFIPKDEPEIIGMETEKIAIKLAMAMNKPLIFTGHTGIAKTKSIARAHQDRKWPHRHVTFNGQTEVDTILGKWVATTQEGMIFKLGILPFCMRYGIALTFNEINIAPAEVNVVIHELVDEGFITLMELDPTHPDFMIYPHPNFRLYGTMNPPELYAGARDLSPALARRALMRRVEELSKEQEAEVVSTLTEVGEDIAASLAEAAHAIRESFHTGKTMYYISTADLIMAAEIMLQPDVDKQIAVELAIVGKAGEEDKDFLRDTFRLQFDPEARRGY